MKKLTNKKIIIIISTLILIMVQIFIWPNINLFARAESKVYRFAGDYNHPPYEYINKKGEFIGFNIDIIRAIAEEQNINIEIIPMEWDKGLNSLKQDKLDGIIGMSKNQEREEYFKFVSPSLINEQVIFTSSQNVYINTLEDLEGLKVAYQTNDFNEKNISKIPKVVAIPKADQESALIALINKEVDAVLGNKLVGIYYLQKNRIVNDIQVVGEPLDITEYGIVVNKVNIELHQILEEGLASIKKDKTYNQIYDKWFRKQEATIYEMISKYKTEAVVITISTLLIILFLTGYNSLLKKQVAKRTRQLERANRELVEQQREIYNLAYFDPITSLPNRIAFVKKLDNLLENASNDELFAVLFLDLDRFKHVNDTLGHDAGDYILKLISDRLSNIIGEDDLLAKAGGDEYFILHPNMKEREDAISLVNRIIENFKEPFYIEEYELYLTTSIGVVIYPDGGLDGSSLIKNSDLALYKAKELGGNAYYIYGKEIQSQGLDRMLLLNQLRQAVEENQLVIHYQPLIDIETEGIVGLEALMRWDHPDKGLVYPDNFIPLAEESGLIIEMGYWILKKACIEVKEWVDKGRDIYVSVNISGKQFQHKNFIKEVKEALSISGLSPEKLILEITETIAISNIRYTIAILNELQKLGIAVAIDDFGTGYSSLSYLSEMGVNELKIDRSFISDIETNDKNKTISNAIIVLAKELGLQVTAEGVENLKQLSILKDMNCDKAQGYYFSKPVTKKEINKII